MANAVFTDKAYNQRTTEAFENKNKKKSSATNVSKSCWVLFVLFGHIDFVFVRFNSSLIPKIC